MMEFILGCNYWASNAGAEMWQNFDTKIIDDDIRKLSEYGIKCIRAFPNWRDFQPVKPLLKANGQIVGYCTDTDSDIYYLDKIMIERFSRFLDICSKYNIKVIVGLLTGWMSGGLFVPVALIERNLIVDPLAQYLEQLFIKGFVDKFKDNESIIAWDLGNECNCMSPVSNRWEAASWTAMVANAIRSADCTRPVVSGMHSLEIEGIWTITDQASFTDILTTHPYPYWCEHTRIDEILSLRTTMLPTAQTKFYAEIGEKPCFAEELGTMGPMLCSNEAAADFLRINMFSLWANNMGGVMWWCANEQLDLDTYPYTMCMPERELGLFDIEGKAKPVLDEIRKFSNFLEAQDFELPRPIVDAVCVLTNGQRQWGVGYMTYVLARMTGLNISFALGDNVLPDSKLYIMPSVNGTRFMSKSRYDELKNRVFDGADLYISIDNGILAEFESFVGLKVIDSYEYAQNGVAFFNGEQIEFSRLRNINVCPTTAQVLAYDNNNKPFITENRYGKGRVFFVNAPLENNLVDMHNAFETKTDIIYRKLFNEHIDSKLVFVTNQELITTYHIADDDMYVVVLNHYDKEQTFELRFGESYVFDKVCYGDKNKVGAFDSCVLKLKRILTSN